MDFITTTDWIATLAVIAIVEAIVISFYVSLSNDVGESYLEEKIFASRVLSAAKEAGYEFLPEEKLFRMEKMKKTKTKK